MHHVGFSFDPSGDRWTAECSEEEPLLQTNEVVTSVTIRSTGAKRTHDVTEDEGTTETSRTKIKTLN